MEKFSVKKPFTVLVAVIMVLMLGFVCPAKEIFEALRQEHIYVRYFPKPRIDNHLRITVGTQEEMEKLIHFLEKYLKNHK